MTDFRQEILDAFGVTQEEVDLVDALTGGPESRERHRHYVEVVLPLQIADTLHRINESLAEVLDGLEIVYE